ncbi:MAG: HAD family hydrolase, partial [Chloroflexota bacterium]
TGGAGSLAFNRAFNEMFGVTDGFARVEFSGRTDRFILQGGLAEHGIEGGVDQHLTAFTRRYYQLLPESIAQRDGYLMPGFPELLAALRDAGARLGLATGNFSQAATIKLRHYGIDGYFDGGGFGEVSTERADVVAAAIRNVANGAASTDILVVGDTPHDITSALENKVGAVGVATSNFTTEELSSAGAHNVFQDFADWQSATKQLLG